MKTKSKLYIHYIFIWSEAAQENRQENTLTKLHADIILFTNKMHFKNINQIKKTK